MNAESIGVVCGIIIGLIICLVIFRVCNKDKRLKSEYDERQLVIRGKAYKAGFYTAIVYLAILTVFFMTDFEIPFVISVLAFFGVALSVTVVAVYSIWNEAYWGLNNQRDRYAIVFVLCAIINLGAGISAIVQGTVFLGTQGPIINLLCGIMLLIIGGTLILKKFIKPEETDDEEEE